MDNFNQIKERCCTHLVEHAENEEITLRQENGEVVERKTDEKHSYSQDIKKATFSCDIIYCDENGDKLFIKEDETPLYQNIREGVITPNVSEYFKCLDYNEKKFERISSKETPSNCKYVPNIDVDINNIVTDKDKYNILYWSIYDNQGHIDSSKQETIETPVDIIKYSGNKIAVICKKEESVKVPYYGPMHVSSYGMNVIGESFEYAGYTTSDTMSSYSVTIDESGKNYAIVNGKVPPIVNWDIQYGITEKEKSSDGVTNNKKIDGLEFKVTLPIEKNIPMYLNEEYIDVANIDVANVSNGCFGIVGFAENGNNTVYQKNGSANVSYNPYANNYKLEILKECNGVIIIFSIDYKDKYPRSNWHFHIDTTAILINFAKSYQDLTKPYKVFKSDNDSTCPLYDENGMKVNELPLGKNYYYAFCYENDINRDGYLIRPLTNEEKLKWMNDSMKFVSSCEIDETEHDVTFLLNVSNEQKIVTIKKMLLPTSIIIDESEKTYSCLISTIDLPNELTYTFTQDCILDIDKDSSYKNIFKAGQTISIPYYSGCTFVPYNS